MKFSYNWLKELVPALPKSEKLAEVLTMHAFEVESVAKHGNDFVLDIAVLPNRIADASGHIGMAREIAAILKTRVVVPKRACKEAKKYAAQDHVAVAIKDRALCGRYIARVVTGVQVKESPAWMRERLEACGLKAINNIVDATNYVMLETGQPLHAFDYDALAGLPAQMGEKKTIHVRRAKKGEHITTLDDAEFLLSENMVVIADDNGPIAIAGIKGGKRAGIVPDTKTIVIEAARFDGPTVRKTSQELALRTDASVRFSVGLDPALSAEAIERVCALIQEIGGGEVLKGGVDVYPAKDRMRSITLRPAYARSVLGVAVTDSEMASILKRLGCVIKKAKQGFTVAPPSIRRDLAIEEDLIEEVGRLYGYEYIIPTQPLGELVPPEVDDLLFWKERMQDALSRRGFYETYNYIFVGASDITAFGEHADAYRELENPARHEFAYVRRSLLPALLKNAQENLKREDTVRMFETGHVFLEGSAKATGEETRIAGFIAKKHEGKKGEAFFELKGALDAFFEDLGLAVWFDDEPAVESAVYHPHRAARLKVDEMPDGAELGLMGEAHPALKEKYGIKGAVAVFELDLTHVAELARKEKEYRPISRYPTVMRDIALLVPRDTRVVEVMDIIENTGGELLIDTDLFDIYEGSEIPNGKKSLAFRLLFQSHERTLTDQEVDAIMERITKALQENLEWEVR